MTNVVSCKPPFESGRSRPIKSRRQARWGPGDYDMVGATLHIVGELLSEAVDVRATDRVLDVAAGNGITFDSADVEALAYGDASFDVVLSTFGVMFAPDHERSAKELMRVCRPAGRIGLASWTPAGFIGQLFRVIGQYVPPVPGMRSPLLWGTDAHLQALFADATRIEHTTRMFAFRYRSAEHWVDVFRAYYGPVHKAFAALEEDGQASLENDLIELLRSRNHGGAEGLVVPGEYLETAITK